MSQISEVVQKGISTGVRLALNPTVENYRSLRTNPEDPLKTAWAMTGKSLRTSMDQVKKEIDQQGR